MPPLDLDLKQGIRNCVESTIQPGSHKEITRVPNTHTQYIASLKMRTLLHLGNGSSTVVWAVVFRMSPLLSEELPPRMPEKAP